MATKHIVSCQVATEPTYGDIDSTSGQPNDPATNTYYAAEISDRATLVMPGDPVMTDVNTVSRNGLYELPPEPASLVDSSGDMIKRRKGEVTLTMPARMVGDGTNYDSFNKMPLFNIANTALQEFENATVGTDVVATADTVTSHTATDATKFAVGNGFKVVINGRVEYSFVTDITGAVLTYSPALSTPLTLAQVVYPLHELIIPSSGVPTTIPSVALKLNGIGWEARCSGCTVTGIEWVYTAETGRIDMTFTIDCAYIDYENVANDTVPVLYSDGGVLHCLKSYLVVSSTGGTRPTPVTAPAALARTAYCLDEWNFKLNIVRSANGCDQTMLGQSDFEHTDYTAEGSVTLGSTSTAFDDDLWNGTMRSILIGFNSGQAEDSGEGGCLMIPAAVLKNDPEKRDTGKDHLRTMLNFGIGPWFGDTDGSDPADSLFRFCMGDIFA